MTGVTVKEILTLHAMNGAQVLAGSAGLDRIVTGANVMEVPDIEAFVKPGELLLTTGFPVRDRPERLVELVGELAGLGLAALAVKPMRYLTHLPTGLRTAAQEHGLPVIVLPDHTSFNDVIGAVLAIVLADYGAEPAGAEMIRERLTGVALSGGGLDGIAAALTTALDRPVTIIDQDSYVIGTGPLAAATLGALLPAADAPAETDAHADGAGPASGVWRFPVTVGGVERGQILVGGRGEPTLGQRRLIRQSCFAAAMHIAQAVASLELDRKMRTLFLEELVTGVHTDTQTVRQRSRLFGWDLAGRNVVLVGHCSRELSEAAVAAAARQGLPRGSLAWLRGSEVVAIVPADAGPSSGGPRRSGTEPLPAVWRAALLRAGAQTAMVAQGPVATAPSELSASHVAARAAIRIARATGMVAVRHEDLVLERLLLANPPDLLREFATGQIGDLVSHDQLTGAELCRTLEVYLGIGNGAEAARRLFIHYNTMKHRLARIEELTGADLHDPRTRLTLALALEARKLTAAPPA
ncbi:MAG: PucR family transcriptional regulator ligand-binding domain-containing protein [Candidatus Nanopelagicales bacterium]